MPLRHPLNILRFQRYHQLIVHCLYELELELLSSLRGKPAYFLIPYQTLAEGKIRSTFSSRLYSLSLYSIRRLLSCQLGSVMFFFVFTFLFLTVILIFITIIFIPITLIFFRALEWFLALPSFIFWPLSFASCIMQLYEVTWDCGNKQAF